MILISELRMAIEKLNTGHLEQQQVWLILQRCNTVYEIFFYKLFLTIIHYFAKLLTFDPSNIVAQVLFYYKA